jgi:transcriptional regulator GlxA family with amidase domain
MDKRIEFLKRLMSSDLKKKWEIDEMAQTVNLSPPHLTNLFKVHTGTSPIHYLRELRLETARSLIENSFERIKEIRVQVGMSNSGHFTRDFKAKFGLTPSEYRRMCWQEVETSKENNLIL